MPISVGHRGRHATQVVVEAAKHAIDRAYLSALTRHVVPVTEIVVKRESAFNRLVKVG